VPPTEVSFQGTRANLTGLVVELKFSDGRIVSPVSETVNSDLWANLQGSYCDEAWDRNSAAINDDYIATLMYKGSTTTTQLPISHVVKATRLEFSQNELDTWYSDERPKFDGLEYNVYYAKGWAGYGSTSKAGELNPDKRIYQKMDVGYPKIDYTDASKYKSLRVFIGVGTNTAETVFKIKNFYEVFDVNFDSAEWLKGGAQGNGYFDDDVLLFYDPKGVNGLRAADPYKVYAELKKSNVKFKINYADGDGKKIEGSEKILDMDQFVANSVWYYNQIGLGSTSLGGNYSTYMHGLVAKDDGFGSWMGNNNVSVLKTNATTENEGQWRLVLTYAPLAFGKKADTTTGYVPIEIFEFDEAERSRLGNNPFLKSKDSAGAFTTIDDPDEFASILRKWELTATYSYEGSDKSFPKDRTKKLTLTEDMFYQGYWVASTVIGGTSRAQAIRMAGQGSSSSAAQQVLIQLGSESVGWNYWGKFNKTNSIQSGEYLTDFPLPLYYRGTFLDDVDEGILIDFEKN